MKRIKDIVAKLAKGLLKISLVVTLCLFLLFFLFAGAVQVPVIQNYLVDKATEYATTITGYTVTIEGIHIDWFDVIVLEEAVLWDQHNAKMIYLGEAEVDYTVISLVNGNFNLDNITLREGEVNLVRYKNEDAINISEFIWKVQELTTPKVKRVGPPVPVVIPKFTLDNMLFSYNDLREPFQKEDYFDHNHFTLDSIHGVVTNLYAVLDTIMLDAHHLRVNLRESHLKVRELNTSFLLDKHQIECRELFAQVGGSELRDYFRFQYKDINDLSDFNEKTDLTIRLKESRVDVRDIAHFAPALNGIKDKLFISGNMKGRINRFSVDSLNLYFGKVGHLKGKLNFDGFPDVSETFMELKFSEINMVAKDIAPYTGASSRDFLDNFGRMNGKGEFIGFVNDFAVKGSFHTGLGTVASDVNFKIHDDIEKSSYKGSLLTSDFNLGKFLGNDIIQKIDMTGEIEGKGFSIEEAELDLKAKIQKLGLNGYEYKNIVTNATLADRFFDGMLEVNDSNLVMNAIGKINLKNEHNEFDIDGTISKAQLDKLQLAKVETMVRTEFNLDFRGTNVDSILGMAKLKNAYLNSNGKEIALDTLYLQIEKQNDTRMVHLSSDIIDATMEGNFYVSELVSDIAVLYKEIQLVYYQDNKQLKEYYSKKENLVKRKYKNEFSFNLKNINNLTDLYYPGVYIAQNTKISGEFYSGKTSRLNLYAVIDSLFYKGNELYRNVLDFSVSKVVDSTNVLATLFITSDAQNFKNSFKTEKFRFEGEWNENAIDFATSIAQRGTTNKVVLNGNVFLQEDAKELIFKKSHLDLLDERWTIADSNSIDFTDKDLVFNFLQVVNKDQSVTLIGNFSADEDKFASIDVNNFRLKNLNPVIDYKLDGTLDGLVKVRNIYKDLDLNGGITIAGFKIDDFTFGDIDGKADWVESEQQLNVNIDVTRDNFKAINVVGNIKPPTTDRREIINLLANFNSADLGFISPVLKGVMSDISGVVDGGLRITGSFNDLRLKGEANIRTGKFKVDYLGSVYTFNDKIYFTEDQIKFKHLELTDINGNKAKINGAIAYDGFKNFLVDIKGTYKNFNVLNTTEHDNTLFYGIAYFTGDFSIFGPFNDLEIRANAKSNKETKIYIPLSSDADFSQKDFIKFVSKKKDKEKIVKDSLNNSSIRMFFNMELTPDAYTEIIFDKRAGDIIRGTGEGNIELRYDSRGDMTMFGNYTITEGWYNFTMAGIVNKEFVIDKGSRISWNGNPYEGILDIKAKYSQYVSLKPLVVAADSALKARPDLQRSYPTDVVLGVKGNLMRPEISMDIDIIRYPSDPQLSTMITDFESKIKTNEQELNRQVFSLIMLRSFTEPNSFSGVSSVGSNTVSELLSSQLSHFLSQVDQNLEINVNLKNMDKNALNTFNLRFTYTALDGRLRISRDGSFQNVQNSSQANVSNIAGEWTVEYLLSKDGKLRIKLFNKINNNTLISSAGNTNTSAGVSLMHVQSFDNLRELFSRRRRRKKAEEELRKDENLLPDSSKVQYNPTGI